jgi:hypothetical protein
VETNFSGTSFTEANFFIRCSTALGHCETSFFTADLTRARSNFADLRAARFRKAILTNVDFANADIDDRGRLPQSPYVVPNLAAEGTFGSWHCRISSALWRDQLHPLSRRTHVPALAEGKKPRFRHKEQGSNNCGPTCLAIIANTTPDKACVMMFRQYRPAEYCYSWGPDICRGLRELRLFISEKERKAKSFHDISALAIVSVEEDEHWIVYSPKERPPLIYDPQAAKPMTVPEYDDYCRRIYRRKYKRMKKIQYYIEAKYPDEGRASLRSRHKR